MNRKKLLVTVGTPALLAGLLLTAGIVYASGGPATGPTTWGIPNAKWMDLLWRTLNFAILVGVLIYFLAKPIANGLKKRQQTIKEQFEDLAARKAEADKTYKSFEEKLAQIEKEVKDIISSAVAQGAAEKEKIIADANRTAGDIKRQAEMAVQYEIAAAKLKLREEVANQAVLMAEELIKKNLQEADQVKLIEEYLAKVGSIQ